MGLSECILEVGCVTLRQCCKARQPSSLALEGTLDTAGDMAKRGARVILACRNTEKGEKAVATIKRRSNNENVTFSKLNLASLQSVCEFSARIMKEEPRIDILVNNAGVMATPYTTTEDGFELQFGVNHLGHFLLTNLLLDRIKEAPAARIVNLSSRAHKKGTIDFADLQSKRSYEKREAYRQSKLAIQRHYRGN